MLRLPADVLFELISAADPETYDQQALLDFVLRLFDRKPSVAIPLIVTLNFCLVTPAHRSAIFQAKSLHRRALNGQIARTLSAARKMIRFEQKTNFGRLGAQLDALHKKLLDEDRHKTEAVKKSVDAEIEKLNRQIAQNQATILNLADQIQQESAEFKKEQEAQAAEIKALRDELNSLSALAAESREQLNDQQSLVRATISEEMTVLSQIGDRLVPEDDSAAYAERADQIDAQTALIDALFESLITVAQKKSNLETDIKELKARLFVKIVRDKLNSGEYIRQTDARYEMLSEEPSVWGLRPDDVAAAEARLLEFEEWLDRLCPIRNLQHSPPSSPSSRGTRLSRSRTAPISPSREVDV
jgi:DNA repair exonuclease SbcCD ATPase subunit